MNYQQEMQKAVSTLEAEYQKLSTGRANPNIFQDLMVEAYGDKMSLIELASVQVSDARQIIIKPYDKDTVKDITHAINSANLGVTIQDDGDKLRANFPSLTADKRSELVKKAKELAEAHKVTIRNIRRTENESLKKQNLPEDQLKGEETEVQKATDAHIKKIDELFTAKEKALTTI